MVCQNQSIDDSDADLAKDLRRLVRERLQAGDTDPQVLSFVTDRYGEFVLLRPVFAPHTLLLWAAPFVALLAGIAGVLLARRKRVSDPGQPLTAEEMERLEAEMAREDGGAR